VRVPRVDLSETLGEIEGLTGFLYLQGHNRLTTLPAKPAASAELEARGCAIYL
jgi:hypothetical protein